MSTQKPLVFVVDDNEYTLLQIRKSLQQAMSCQVLGFRNANDCLVNLHLNPDFILSDYNLTDESDNNPAEPVMNGEQLLVQLKNSRPEIPVMMYSSRNSVALAVRLMKKGAADFMNSDATPHTTLFTGRIAENIKRERARIHRQLIDRQLFRMLLTLCIVFVLTISLLALVAPNTLPFVIAGFLILAGSLIFLGQPSMFSQLFTDKKKNKHDLHAAEEAGLINKPG